MKKKIAPSDVRGQISPPPSKSYMQRAVAIAAISEGTSRILNPSYSDDGLASLSIAEQMGAEIKKEKDAVTITGGKSLSSKFWDCGESGLSIRMFSAIAGLQNEPITLTGHGSMPNRSMQTIQDTLVDTGLTCKLNGDRIPIEISNGPLKAGEYQVDGSASSQPLTGLMIALSALKEDSILRVQNLKSKPYIDITLDILKHFGIEVTNVDYKKFIIPGAQDFKSCRYNVEADWSGASFLAVAGAIAGEVTISNINSNSHQGDRAILDVITQVGANTSIKGKNIGISKNQLNSFIFDATDCPDLFPPLAALALNCEGTSLISGVHRLKHKESDRFATIQEEFGKLGANISLDGDTMVIPGTQLTGSMVSGRNDHRIAMALGLAGLRSKGYVIIDDWECIAKSYPAFFDDLSSLGGAVSNVE